MNKKGFTLVELLAVIAILAILVIIALPNVIKLYNNAKKNTFLTEAKTVYKEAANKYITESMKGNKVNYISSTKNSLELNGSKDIEYKISLNNDGSIRRFQVKNNSYCINGKYNDANELIIDDVTEKECAEVDATYCKSNLDTLETGSEVIIGKYTYRYNQTYYNSTGWADYKNNGWGVILTDKESTDDITEVPCTFIDDKPIISLGYAFHSSKAKNIDLSGINTNHVTNMDFTFGKTSANTINILDFDTSNVKGYGMTQLFNSSNVKKIYGLEYFDTSKVTNMYYMFAHTSIDNLNISNFDTSNVQNMSWMFRATNYKSLDLTNFDTSKVYSYQGMFYGSTIDNLNISNFNLLDSATFDGMFSRAKINNVYTKNKVDADKFKSKSEILENVNFTYKNNN